MSSVKTPNYILSEDHVYEYDFMTENKLLPKGSFVKPISLRYVPKHTVDKWVGVDHNTHTFAYTRRGIIPIPRKKIIEV